LTHPDAAHPGPAVLSVLTLTALLACEGAAKSPPDPTPAAVKALAAGKLTEAFRGFDQGCKAGQGAACDALGKLLAEGRGVTADPARAETLYRRACDAGTAAGCANLGAVVAGRGEDTAAADLFRRACVDGDVAGCSNLGVMYGLGRGVTKDLDRAGFLARWSCDGGDALACSRVPK